MHQLRVAARALTRAPGFTAAAILTLALGIGLSTAVFTVADALLRRELPVGEQDRLVVLWGETRDRQFSNYPLPLEDVRAFQARSRTIEEVAFFAFRGATATPVRIDDRVESARAALVSGNFFDVLRSPAALGRTLRPADDVAGAAPVLVLSHRAWRQQFGADPAIVGRSVELIESGRPYTVVGVMAEGLAYPHGTDAWIPLIAHGAANGFLDIVTGELDMLGRLQADATPAQARQELTDFFRRPEAPAAYSNLRGVAYPLVDVVLGDTKPALLVFTIAAALLLFITCVNVANLLLVRALRRARELVVRAALGASRRRIAAQLLTESALLCLGGGVLGFAFAAAVVRVFRSLAPASFPRIDAIGIDLTALMAGILVTGVAMLLSGLGPALFSSRVHAHDALRSGPRHSGDRLIRTIAEGLVVAQVALAAVSLSAAGLITRSLVNLIQVDLAFESSHLIAAGLVLRQNRSDDPRQAVTRIEQLLPALEALPGVQEVTPVLTVPFVGAGGGIDGRLATPEQTEADVAGNPVLNIEAVAPDYFATLGIPLLRGRAFSNADREGSPPVVIVSSSTARHFWPDDDPIGRRVRAAGQEATVVGVVPDTRYRDLRTARPAVYFALGQSRFPVAPTTLLIRTDRPSLAIVPAMRRTIAELEPDITLGTASSLEALLDAPRAQPRLNTMVLALFAAAAVSLAAIGLFAIITTMVAQRRKEIGIRLALGARAADVRRMIMRRGLTIAAIGAAIGIAGTLALSRLLSALLFGVSPTDAPTLLAVVALMLSVAAAATFVPARSTQRIDPIVALRSEP